MIDCYEEAVLSLIFLHSKGNTADSVTTTELGHHLGSMPTARASIQGEALCRLCRADGGGSRSVMAAGWHAQTFMAVLGTRTTVAM